LKYPRRVIVDTDTLIVANGKSSQASIECELAAINFLEYTIDHSIVVLDSEDEILDEYKKYCSYSGQPGVGDLFFRELHNRRADTSFVQIVEIHPDGIGSYVEIPATLTKFDPSDKKFIATALADKGQAIVVNCVDSDYAFSSEALRLEGIRMLELCPECLKRDD
jgi:hypothetical protein